MQFQWIFSLAIAVAHLPALSYAAAECTSPYSPETLYTIVQQLTQCQERVDRLLERTATEIGQRTGQAVFEINHQRDQLLESIRVSYARTDVADSIISAVVIQSSQQTEQFGQRKRAIAHATVVRLRDLLHQSLNEVDALCALGERPARAVLENTKQRVLRRFERTIAAVRYNTETMIAATIKNVIELGETALQLNDRVLTTAAARRTVVQQQLAAAVEGTLRRTLDVFKQFDGRIVKDVTAFVRYLQQAEQSQQALSDYVSDLRTGIVKIKL